MCKPYDIRKYQYYCPKCGQIHFIDYASKEVCLVCGTKMQETPHEYNFTEEKADEDYDLFEQAQKKFVDEVVSKLPEFDRELYNNRDKILQRRSDDFHAMMENYRNAVKCHYCGSTNVQKITLMSKAIHNSIFGIWSLGRNTKEFHCNNCGADF